ncbi:hypothetical protein ABG768_017030 [Culter alburnus]|uniref:WKF domain-containing protein n=1 Tax=Culter alburnus TaxID=194366 RepID=A0AAW1YV39_CULAL
MMKSQALVPQSDSLKKKKVKHNVDEITCVQDERKDEMNGKKKKKKKKSEADDEVCEHTENISEKNTQMIQSADTNTHEENTEIHKHKKKKKKRKAEELETSTHLNGDQKENIHKKKKSEVCVPVENTTEEPQDTEQLEDMHKQDDHTKKKKKKKRKHKDPEAAVPESDPVTPQEEETNTHAAKERAEKSTAETSGDVCEPSGVEDGNGSDGEEELSPEEKRVLERKVKKILKKEEKKKLKEEGKYTKPEKSKSSVKEKQALEYLTCWSEKREEWKFNKNSQTWLLHHMFDSVKVSDDHFEVLLSYLDGLRGTARDSTLQKAEAIVRWEGQGEEADTADAEKRKLRAKQVVQML